MSTLIQNVEQLHKKVATTKANFIKLHLQEGTTNVLGSKMLGIPYWEDGIEYPVDTQGDKMKLFVQINFADMPAFKNYPDSGIFQWFMSVNTDVYGCDFGAASQEDYKIVYWDKPVLEKAVYIELEANDEYALPTSTPRIITFSVEQECCGSADYQAIELYKLDQAFQEGQGGDEYYELHSLNQGHKMGGYAFFTQTDPREDEEPGKAPLLFMQIDDDIDLCWGDSGVANLFIHEKDLISKNFDKIKYYWDCH